MKRIALFASAVAFSLLSSAQINMKQKISGIEKYKQVSDGSLAEDSKKTPGIPFKRADKGLGEVVLGVTLYDLQGNAAVHDRIAMNANGDMAVVWTASEEASPFNDRGAGYSFYDATNNEWTISADYPRIESDRCGWPSILFDGSGGEILISHSTAANVMRFNSRSAIGTGSWSEKTVSSRWLWWNRAAMGGTDGNTIHMIATAADADDSVDFQLMAQPMLYFRSQDAGQTWDILDSILPGLDSGSMGVSSVTSNDAYAIDVRGTHVAIGMFNVFNDVILMESMDNGNTWTKTIAYDFPYKGFRDFKNKHSDTVYIETTDGSGTVMIDDNGDVHMSWGRRRIANSNTGGGFFSFLYLTDSLRYFRKSSGGNSLGFSGYYIDANNDTAYNFSLIGYYSGNGIVSHPNLAFGNDTVYLVWSGVADTISSGIEPGVNMRQIYMMKSANGGNTWSDPVRLTNTDMAFSDNVYPDIYPRVDDRLQIVYQRDIYAGNYVSAIGRTANSLDYNQASASDNDIVYLEVTLSGGNPWIGIEEVVNKLGQTDVYPNPSNGQFEMNINVYQDTRINVNVTNASGQVVHTYNGQPLVKGGNRLQMDLSHLQPGMYLLNIFDGNKAVNKKIVIK